jgi:CBS domain-containing membrane protein
MGGAWQVAAAWVRQNPHPLSLTERLVSAAGGFCGILAVLWVSGGILDLQGAAWVAASMGASAVLLFAVPHGALSQPWPVLGGHLVSAAVGVACARLIGDPWLAGPLAVGLAIGAMQTLRCIHPPGGATALAAVVGGPAVQALGWGYLVAPVLVNGVTILGIALLFNYPFRWRRYPLALAPAAAPAPAAPLPERMIAHSDLVYALSQIDSFIDVEEEDLLRIYALALGHGREGQEGGRV